MWSKPFFMALATFAVQLGLNFLLAVLRDWLGFSSFNSFSFGMYFGVHLLAATTAGCLYAARHSQEPAPALRLKTAIYYGLIWAGFVGFTFWSNQDLLAGTSHWASLLALLPISSLFGLITYTAVGIAAHFYLRMQKRRL
ncbi:MAG: hypothetical protein KME07_24490 [Pegethrix bostrychoides GSE-TBD4-15B]|jgi:hypothetical protein|uniref:Uncharacterized protein n=1 Tax=Pegethrix bostrychoides GSE-TBD4-15B TaxID=2839662 RepID=A0A951PF75_9CYAN|nr:hypothetical protein [Pegethrix bostrychoides GSE-TBD4-15B]